MANPTITNTTLHPQDGWVELASGAATAFLRVSYFPHHVPVFLFAGSSAPSLNPVAATGSVVFTTGIPLATQTITIGTETWTFAATRTVPFTVAIGVSNTATATNFAAAVNTDSQFVTAADVTGTVTITAVSTGPQGNLTISGTAAHTTLTSMTGGALAQAGFRMDCGGTHFDGAYDGNLYGRIMLTSNDKVIISVWQL